MGVEETLNVHTDGTSALVEDSIGWLVVDESSHGHSLLLTATEDIVPVIVFVKSTFSWGDIFKFDDQENLFKILVGDSSGLHLLD